MKKKVKTRYHPKAHEIERFTEILRTSTPSEKLYKKYLSEAESFLETASEYSAGSFTPSNVGGFMLYESELFFGRQFLVGLGRTNWMKHNFPGWDAVAANGFELLGLKIPPLLFIREDKTQDKSRSFKSIIEHEIVHVNQALLGCFPSQTIRDNPHAVLSWLMSVIKAEYQANLLQLIKWPDLFDHHRLPLSLDHWCIFRGYTQAIEMLIQSVLNGEVSLTSFTTMFEKAEKTFPKAFIKHSLDQTMAEWLLPRVNRDVSFATVLTIKRAPHLVSPLAADIMHWLKRRTKSQSKRIVRKPKNAPSRS